MNKPLGKHSHQGISDSSTCAAMRHFSKTQDDTPESERVDAFASLLFEAMYPYVMPEHRGVFGE